MPWGKNDRFFRHVSDSTPSEFPESGYGFVLHNAGDEWVKQLKFPEIDGGKAEG